MTLKEASKLLGTKIRINNKISMILVKLMKLKTQNLNKKMNLKTSKKKRTKTRINNKILMILVILNKIKPMNLGSYNIYQNF